MQRIMLNWRNIGIAVAFFIFGTAPVILFSQTNPGLQNPHQIDSLKKLIPGSGTKKQVDLLNELAGCYAPVNFDSSIFYSSTAARLATHKGYNKGLGLARYNAGNAHYCKMDFKNALVNYLSALTIFEEGNFSDALGDLYRMLGHLNFFTTRGDKATFYYRKALGCFMETGNSESLDNTYRLMAMALFFLSGQPVDSALFYAHKTLEYARKITDPRREVHALMVTGMIYLLEDNNLAVRQKFLAYNDTALKMAVAFNDHERQAIIHINYGSYYDMGSPLTGNPELSKAHYLKGYVQARMSGNKHLQSISLNCLSEYDIREYKFTQASTRLDSCEAVLNSFFRSAEKNVAAYNFDPFNYVWDYYLARREKISLFQNRFKLAITRGEFRKAVEYQRRAFESKEELRSEQQGQQMDMLIAEDESNKQRERIGLLARDNELAQLRLSRARFMFIGAGIGVVVISMSLLYWFQRKQWKAEQRSANLEQKLLRSQMNPHFIFNSLASIQNFVVNQKANEASIYLSRFSQLVRNILDNSTEEYVPLQKETETIRHYLELQQVRYAGQFTYTLTVDDRIDQESVIIPPMLAQPFIENSIEHGIRYKETAGHIDVRFRLENNLLRFELEDDGVGREKAREIALKQNRGHRSLSTSITNDRLEKLNKKLKSKISIRITDLKNQQGEPCGTRVTFAIPLKQG